MDSAPVADLDRAVLYNELVREFVAARFVAGVHDCSEGGLAVALAEMAIAGACGFHVFFDVTLVPALAWFSESASRVVFSVEPANVRSLLQRCYDLRVTAVDLGEVTGDRLVAEGAFDVSLADAVHAWQTAIPSALGLPAAR